MSAPHIHRTGRAVQALGTLAGLNPATYQVVSPRSSWKRRLLRWCLRRTARLLRRLVRMGWHRRRILAPWYIAAVVWAFAAIASQVERGWVTVATVAALGAAPLWWWSGGWAWRFTRRHSLKPTAQRVWYAGSYAAISVWAVVAAAWTAMPPWLGVEAVITLVCWVAWAWHHRIRHPEPHKVAGDVLEFDGRLQRWRKIADQGKPLAGAELENITDHKQPVRWTADIALPSGDLTVENVLAAHRRICSAYSTRRDNVILDEAPGGAEDRARLTVVADNPCHGAIEFDDSWQAEYAPGCFPFHTYPDGFRGGLRLWQPMSGTAHALFTGDTRSGKSAGMEAGLVQACMTGLVFPIVGDPQGGQSMPAWVGEQGMAPCRATEPEGVARQLTVVRGAMYARSRLLQRMRWSDEDGEHVGMGFFDPAVCGLPILLYVLDEAHVACKDPEWGPIIVTLIEEIVKMAGKTGIALWLATQYPGIEELGNKMSIRQNVVAGNVICYRNSAPVSKGMVLPSHMPAPHAIPKETPDGEHTKGTAVIYSAAPRSSRATYARSVWVRRAHHMAQVAAARIPDLWQADPVTAEALAPLIAAEHMARTGVSAKEAIADVLLPHSRETVTVTPKPERALDRITAYLRGRADGRAHTGVIADALDLPKGTVGTTLKRAEKNGLVHQPRRGVWALGKAPQEQLALGTDVGQAA